MTDEEIIQGILEGCSLRTFMVPDPAISTNRPEHIESYDLPHVNIKGKHFKGEIGNWSFVLRFHSERNGPVHILLYEFNGYLLLLLPEELLGHIDA